MEKKLSHRGLREAQRIQLPAVPTFPRLTVTPKQVPKAKTSSSEKATCKLPPLQAAASATSARGRALGTEALSHRELLPPLPCVSAERDRTVRAERWERVPHSPVAPAEDVEYAVQPFVSTRIRNSVACNEEANSKARLSPSGRGPRTTGHRTPPLPTAVPRHLKKSRHPAPHSPTDSFTALQERTKSVVSEAVSKAIARMREEGQRPAALGDPAHMGRPVTATRSAGVQTDMESRWTAALPGFDSRGGARKPTASRDQAPASPGRVEKQDQKRAQNIKPRQGSSKEGTSQGRGREESSPVGWDQEEEIVIINSWINPRFARLFQEPQAFAPEEGSSSSTVDREAAAEEAVNPTSASLDSSESTDTALSAASLAEGPGEERHGTPLTAPAPAAAERTPASPLSAPICEDEGYRAPGTPGGQDSKPSACPCPSEHSTAVLVESQGCAQPASSVSEEELYERAKTVVAAVLLRCVANMQAATSKEPSAPSAAWPRVPPPIPEPVDCTAVDQTGAVASPLATVPGHQVAAEQGGQAQSSCTKDTPADEPATCQKQEPSQGLLDGPVQSSEQEQGLGIHDLAQAPAHQPRPARSRRPRALRALCVDSCCSFMAEEWE